MLNWIKTTLRLPPQGKKILCLNKGDVDIRQRFGPYWSPIPYLDSEFTNLDAPEMWSEFDLPNGLTGLIRILVEGNLLTIDELEFKYPKQYEEIVRLQYEYFITKKAERVQHEYEIKKKAERNVTR